MDANRTVRIDGIGELNYQRAIDLARNTEGPLNPALAAYLEGALQAIWGRILINPTAYVMTRDEFAVFNYFRARYDDDITQRAIAEMATARHWENTRNPPQGRG